MCVGGAGTLLAPMGKMAESTFRITQGPLNPQPSFCFLEGHISKLGLFTRVHSGLLAGNGSLPAWEIPEGLGRLALRCCPEGVM